jgi:nitronate monooxygenase
MPSSREAMAPAPMTAARDGAGTPRDAAATPRARRVLPFALRLPIFAAPMFLISGPDLVIEASRAGVIGAFPNLNVRTSDEYDAWMKRISGELAAVEDARGALPWAANLVTHSTNARLPQDLAVIARYRPPIVITSLGSPRPAVETVRAYGGLVFADVTTMRLAEKAAAAGVDGIACICAGAGGHTGALSPFAFVSAVRAIFDGLIVVGGGIADGWGIAGAIAAGADLAYVGTRFIPTHASTADPRHKQMIVDCGTEDLLLSSGLTGAPVSWLKPSLIAAGVDPDNMPPTPEVNHDSTRDRGARRWKDVWSAGQGLGAVRAIQSVDEVIAELEHGYRAAIAHFRTVAG